MPDATDRREPDEFDDSAPPRRGECGRCDHGWVNVGPGYVRKIYEDQDLTDEQVDRIRAATVYPCRNCNAALFFRWVGGHLEPDHETKSCEECSGDRPRRRGHRRPGPSMVDRERADLA